MPTNQIRSFLAIASASTIALLLTNVPARSQFQRAPAAAEGAAQQQDAELIRAMQQGQQVQPEEAPRRGGRGTAARGRSFGTLSLDPATAGVMQPASSSAVLTTDAAQSNEPKDLILLKLWVITVEMPKAKAADDLVAGLVHRVNELPAVLKSEEVPLLLGKLSVAGVLRRSREFQLLAANGQMAINQSGAMIPMIQNSSVMFSGARGGEQRE